MEPTSQGRGWRKLISLAVGVVTVSAGTGVASAGGGGIATPDPPVLRDVVCAERCADLRAASVGSTVRLTGANLGSVDEILFAGSGSGRVAAKAASATNGEVLAKVPDGAATGTVVASSSGGDAETTQELRIVAENQITSAGAFKLSSAEATPHKTFYDGKRAPKVSYMFQGGGATDVRIEVVNRETKETVASFFDRAATPNAENVAKWDGRTTSGTVAPNAEYKFRIGSAAGGDAETTADATFGYYRFRFPVRAKHTYGDGFGAGRNHQGQDVFAKCGTKMYAARGGRVQWNKVHASAGNYVVIDLKGSKADHMYAHLQQRSPLQEGARVRTGQLIGNVGDTGNASGCHLHFEIWSGPGWYEGGSALPSVRRQLKLWDSWS